MRPESMQGRGNVVAALIGAKRASPGFVVENAWLLG